MSQLPPVDYEPRRPTRSAWRTNLLTCLRAALLLWLLSFGIMAIITFAGIDTREGNRPRRTPITLSHRLRDGTLATALAATAAIGLTFLRPRPRKKDEP
jgi:hypothetical protein